MNVAEWLRSLGLSQYVSLFEENDIDLEILPDLTEVDLEKLGISLGHRKRLIRAISTLVEGSDSVDGGASATEVDLTEPIPMPPTGDAERRQLTVMFCDLVGSTTLSGTVDPEEFRAIIQTYQEACSEVVTRFEGYVAKYMGDGILAYFGYPQAHEDDAERAVRAGLGIVEAVSQLKPSPELSLQVRIGIATGLVVVGDLVGEGVSEERAVSGATPNLAARLQTQASPNSIIISPATRELVAGLFAFESLGEQQLDGISEAVQIWQVTGELGIESRFEAVHGQGLKALVARNEEIDLLMGRWRSAKQGEGQVVLLTGEPGIGKSRICQALRERLADEPHTCLRYQCSPYHTNSALYPITTQLELAARFADGDTSAARLAKLETVIAPLTQEKHTVIPILAAALSIPMGDCFQPPDIPPDQLKERTFEVLYGQVAALAREQPVLILFEDVHWVDPTTLEMLDIVVRRVQEADVLVVITMRPEFVSPWTGHTHVTSLTLNRLGRRHCELMVDQVTGGKSLPDEVLDQIVSKTDGVPLFVEELTKTVLEAGFLRPAGDRYELDGTLPALAIPATLQDSLMARLDRLLSVKDVAQIGATIGREFSYELVSAVSPLPEQELDDALQQLVGSELVFRSGTPPNATYTFKHALVQDAAYASLLKTRRSSLHGSVAAAILKHFPAAAESEPESLAHHFSASGDDAATSPYWEAAGRRAADRSAHVEAAEHLRRALESAVAHADTHHRFEIGLALCASLRVLGRSDETLDVLSQIEPLVNSARDKARLHHLRGNIHFLRGDSEQNILEQRAALTHARAAQDVEQEMHALSGIADAEYMRGRMVSAFDHYDACATLASEHDHPAVAAGNIAGREHARLLTVGPRLSRGPMTDGIEFIVKAEHLRGELILRSNMALMLLDAGEPEARWSRPGRARKSASASVPASGRLIL